VNSRQVVLRSRPGRKPAVAIGSQGAASAAGSCRRGPPANRLSVRRSGMRALGATASITP